MKLFFIDIAKDPASEASHISASRALAFVNKIKKDFKVSESTGNYPTADSTVKNYRGSINVKEEKVATLTGEFSDKAKIRQRLINAGFQNEAITTIGFDSGDTLTVFIK